MRWIAAVGMVLLAAACASTGGRSNCAPVPQEFLSDGIAYRDCNVSLQAELKTPPRMEAPMRMDGAIACMSAWFEFVVDTTGHIVEPTAKLVRTNNKVW